MIFDTHAHYDSRAFDEDREMVLAGLRREGVHALVNVSADLAGMETGLALARKYDFIYASAGVHPTSTDELEALGEQAFVAQMERLLTDSRVVAVGEIGLDYHWDNVPRAIQKKWFELQLSLAAGAGLPVIIHSREAAADTLELLKACGCRDGRFVMHCFSYEKELAARYLDMGFYLGIGGVVTYKNGRKLKEVVSYMPADRILLETDCPYLSPVPHRGERNYSGYLPLVIEEIAALKGMEAEEIENITWDNAMRFYRPDQRVRASERTQP